MVVLEPINQSHSTDEFKWLFSVLIREIEFDDEPKKTTSLDC